MLQRILALTRGARAALTTEKPARTIAYKASLSDALPEKSGVAALLNSPNALPSLRESVEFHLDHFDRNQDVESFVTSDKETLAAAEKIASENPWIIDMGIFSPPEKTGKIPIQIADIGKENDERRLLAMEFKHGRKERLVSVGGPSAESLTVLCALFGNIETLQLRRDFKESNEAWSASQHHARSSAALFFDPARTGHALLPKFLARWIKEPTLTEVLQPDFLKIDLRKENIFLKNIPLYLENEWHWLKNEWRHFNHKLTDHIISAIMAEDSLRIADLVAMREAVVLNSSHLKHGYSSAVHITTTEKEDKELEFQYNTLALSSALKRSVLGHIEALQMLGRLMPATYKAYLYRKDNQALFSAHKTCREIAIKNGASWEEGTQLTKIFLDDAGTVAGVEYIKNGEIIFLPASHVYLSPGYKSEIILAENGERISPKMDTATGCSLTAVFKLSPQLQKIIADQNGRIPEVSISNTHWTHIANKGDMALIRITGGGNIASDMYRPAYAINMIENTYNIFGAQLVGIVSAYGCPQSVNARNNGEFINIADGLVAYLGQGGSGITKKWSAAKHAIKILGLEETSANLDVALKGNIALDHNHIADFIKDKRKATKEALGCREKIQLVGIFLILITAEISSERPEQQQAEIDQPNAQTERKWQNFIAVKIYNQAGFLLK